MPKEEEYNRRIRDLPHFQGRYFTGGAVFPDAIRKIMPLVTDKLKKFSRKKIREFAGDFGDEMDKGTGVRKALKKSAKRTVRKILTGGRKRKSLKAKKPRKSPTRRKRVKHVTRSRDFLS
jgi:hypothetical protein